MSRCRCILAILFAACAVAAHGQSGAQGDVRVTLMAEALQARNAGDLAAARQGLLRLLEIDPADKAAQQMLLAVNMQIEREGVLPPKPGLDLQEVEELTRAESLRLKAAEDLARDTIKRARRLARDKRVDEALDLIDAALAGPPLPPEQEQLLIAARRELQPTAKQAPAQEAPRVSTKSPKPVTAASPAPEAAGKFQHLLVTGKAHLIAGANADAQQAFLDALALQPADPDATRLLEEASLRLRHERDTERLSTRREMLGDVDRAWIAPSFITLPGSDGDIGDRQSPLRERLAQVHVPRASYSALPLTQVLDSLATLAAEEGYAVNLMHANPGGDDPQVTLNLRDLPLDRVLHYVAESVGYEIQADRDAVILRPSLTPGIPLFTEFFPISRSTIIRLTGLDETADVAADPFAPPAAPQLAPASQLEVEGSLRSFLERAGVPFERIPGSTLALADGQLIVTQTPGNLDKVRTILRRYNQTKQVEIEARFLEVQEGELEELGVDWMITNANEARRNDMVYTGRGGNRSLAQAFGGESMQGELVITGLPDGVGSDGTLRQSLNPPRVTGAIDLAAGALPFAELGGLIGDFDVDAIVRALARRTGNDLMSAPKLTVLSGKKAEIVVAQEMIYPRSYGDIDASVGRGGALDTGGGGVAVTAGTPRDFVTRNVGVEMTVTPTVEDDDSVSLLLEPRVTEFEGFMEYGGPSVAISGSTTVTVPSGFYQPIFSVRRVRTEVTIWDGATVIMGGLTREQAIKVQDKVPVLGDIPLLGRLFRSEGESTQKRNLLIFVTARLVTPGGGPVRRSEPLGE